MTTRLQKFIASTGLVSRRRAEELIVAGQVLVNGKKVTKLGTTIDPENDIVTVNGKTLAQVTSFRYIALNKPAGVVCTRAQYDSEKTVYDIVPESRGLVIAGRLDKDSDGLVILTNDGELANTLTHPRFGHEKEYEVVTAKPLDEEATRALQQGVKLEEGVAKFDRMTQSGERRYRIVLHQGWKRQIRRMMSAVHNHVSKLTRVRMQKLTLGDLKVGEWREVRRFDIIEAGQRRS